MDNRPFKLWPNMVVACVDDVQYLLKHHEEWVHRCKHGRAPSNRPLTVWPDGRCRVEFGATFKSISEARRCVESELAGMTTNEAIAPA